MIHKDNKSYQHNKAANPEPCNTHQTVQSMKNQPKTKIIESCHHSNTAFVLPQVSEPLFVTPPETL